MSKSTLVSTSSVTSGPPCRVLTATTCQTSTLVSTASVTSGPPCRVLTATTCQTSTLLSTPSVTSGPPCRVLTATTCQHQHYSQKHQLQQDHLVEFLQQQYANINIILNSIININIISIIIKLHLVEFYSVFCVFGCLKQKWSKI